MTRPERLTAEAFDRVEALERFAEERGVYAARRRDRRPRGAAGDRVGDRRRDEARAGARERRRRRVGAERRRPARTSCGAGRLSELVAFLAVAAVVIVTPGQDTALTIRNTLRGRRRRGGTFTAAGVSRRARPCWTLAASAGLAALLVASEPAFLAVKLLGAAYLVLLGAQSLLHALRGHEHAPLKRAKQLTGAGAFRQGLVSNLGNPKMAVFFSSLLPRVRAAAGRRSRRCSRSASSSAR